MRLPYDYARCPGVANVLCHNCRRREDGHPTEQLMIYPAAVHQPDPSVAAGR